MRKMILVLLFLCLVGCESSSNSKEETSPSFVPETMTDKMELSEEQCIKIQELFESDPVFFAAAAKTGYNVQVEFKENSIEVYVDSENVTPAIIMKNNQGEWQISYCFNQRIDFHYDHPEETDRLAYLWTDYYVNSLDEVLPEQVLICTLEVPESKEYDSFNFVYDEKEKQFLNNKEEPILFAKDLKNKMIDFCDRFLKMNKEKKESADHLVYQTMQIINADQSYEMEITDSQKKEIKNLFQKNEILQKYATHPIDIFVSDNQIMLDTGPKESPTLIMTKGLGWTFERYYHVRVNKIEYVKNNEQRSATLIIDYYVNADNDKLDSTLLCRLETPKLEPTGYNFVYDPLKNQLINDTGEEIVFTRDLQRQLIEICNLELNRFKELDNAVMNAAYESIELMDNELKEVE